MRRIKSVLTQKGPTYYNTLIWAACCVGFFGFLRCGEFLVPDGSAYDPSTHLSLADISLDSSGKVWSFVLNIKVSKTDQFRKGASVAALLEYLAVRGATPGALFQLEDGKSLKRWAFTSTIQHALTSSGLDGSHFNGHSFRIGAATTANSVGLADSTIKHLGRWQSEAYQGYIRPAPEDLTNVACRLASKDPAP